MGEERWTPLSSALEGSVSRYSLAFVQHLLLDKRKITSDPPHQHAGRRLLALSI